MYIQGILEVVIGLVFLWLVISLATMSIQDWIASIFNLRANALEKTIGRMLGDQDLLHRFYEYPLIANLYKQLPNAWMKPRFPSYIPPANFSSTVFELILQAGTENSPVRKMSSEIENQLNSIGNTDFQKLAQSDWEAIVTLASKVTTSGLGTEAFDSLKFQIQNFGQKYPEFAGKMEKLIELVNEYYGSFVTGLSPAAATDSETGLTMRQFLLGVQTILVINPRLGTSLKAIIKQAEGYALQGDQAVAATRTNLETWFNDAMNRLSNDYKQKAQVVAFIIGMILTLFFNIDSISIANILWKDPTLRQAIVSQAQVTTMPVDSQNGSPTVPTGAIQTLETQLQALNIPFGWNIAPFDVQGRKCSLLPTKPNQVWGIPGRDKLGSPTCGRIVNLPSDSAGWIEKVIGLLITGMAVAQGAPFWFDVIKKMIGIRSPAGNTSNQQTVG